MSVHGRHSVKKNTNVCYKVLVCINKIVGLHLACHSEPFSHKILNIPLGQLPIDLSQFAVEFGPTSAKYKNVDVFLFDDKLMLLKQSKGKYYLLSGIKNQVFHTLNSAIAARYQKLNISHFEWC